MNISTACDKNKKLPNDTYLSVFSYLQQPVASFVYFMLPVSLKRKYNVFISTQLTTNFPFYKNKFDKNVGLIFVKNNLVQLSLRLLINSTKTPFSIWKIMLKMVNLSFKRIEKRTMRHTLTRNTYVIAPTTNMYQFFSHIINC